MIDLILFPTAFFDSNQVDGELQAEYDAVISTGLFDVTLFENDKWFNEEKLVLDKTFTEMKNAVYRGWMMKPLQYQNFYDALIKQNIKLITSPEQYKLMHIFPNVYEYLIEDTAKMEIFPLHSHIDLNSLQKQFNRFMVKDYVKSVKGTNFPKYFDQYTSQDEFEKWMEVFYKYRGNLLTGGICVKEYLPLKRYGDKTNEYRVFYMNNEVATISRNSGQGIYAPLPPQEILKKYKNLDSVYYTIDYAELEDGSWKIIEAGDGEVSGLSEFQDYEQYFKILYNCFAD